MTTTELANEQFVSITTFKRDGTPVSTPVWVAGENGNLLVISEADSWKVKRIRRDGHVRITPCSARGTPHGEAADADATLDSDTAAVEKLLAQKYGWIYRAYTHFSALTRRLRRQATPTGITIRITPRRGGCGILTVEGRHVSEGPLPSSREARQLTTVLFVDIVDSTPLAVSLGDHGWAMLLEQYHELVRETVARHCGRLMDTAGDGFFAIFDEVEDALGCALEIRDSSRPLRLELRAGAHVGHCWNADDKCAGADVHVGARLAGIANPGEVLLSEAAAERARRAGAAITDRGARSLKGLPGTWRVFAVESTSPRPVRS